MDLRAILASQSCRRSDRAYSVPKGTDIVKLRVRGDESVARSTLRKQTASTRGARQGAQRVAVGHKEKTKAKIQHRIMSAVFTKVGKLENAKRVDFVYIEIPWSKVNETM